LQVDPDIEVVFSNTHVEHKETYEFRDKLVKEWNLNYTELKPYKTFWECVKEYGYPDLRIYSLPKHKKGGRAELQDVATTSRKSPLLITIKKKGLKELSWELLGTRATRGGGQ